MNIVIYIYQGLTLLDAIGPYEVFRNLDGVEVTFVAKKRGKVQADTRETSLYATKSISDIKEADILLIPGSTVSFIKEMNDKKVLDWIKLVDLSTKKTLTVCTGSIILAATGLLKGKQATSHWKPLKMLEDFEVTPINKRYVEQGKYITAAGVSAGIDMALYVAKELQGETAAQAAQLAIEYDPAPLFDSGNVEKASEEVIKLAEKQMEKDARKDLSALDLVKYSKSLRKLRKS